MIIIKGIKGMNLIEEAVIIEIFGIRMYAFGVYVTAGVLFAMIVLWLAGKALRLKKGTVPLTAFCSMACGIIVSRMVFCLLNQELGELTPVSFWPHLDGGGWSIFGLIGGVYLGGWISAHIMKEETGRIQDALSLSILPMIAAERIGESRIEDFDISRPLDNGFLSGSFLATGGDEPCLATYYVAAAAALVLFIILAVRFTKGEKAGSLTNAFLILYGATAIITESLRYDRFLSISFVGLQQIAAALMLLTGVILAIRKSNCQKSARATIAVISMLLMVAAVIGLEFALDRTTWNKMMIYALMILAVGIPATLGITLIKEQE